MLKRRREERSPLTGPFRKEHARVGLDHFSPEREFSTETLKARIEVFAAIVEHVSGLAIKTDFNGTQIIAKAIFSDPDNPSDVLAEIPKQGKTLKKDDVKFYTQTIGEIADNIAADYLGREHSGYTQSATKE